MTKLHGTHFRDSGTMSRGGRVAGISAWRVNDAVAYDAMRESATLLTSLLLRASREGALLPPQADSEITQLRQAVLGVDGYDRAAVSSLAARIADRIADLTGSRP